MIVISDSANNRLVIINEETMECVGTIGNGRLGLVDGSYSLLVQHYVRKHGGQIANGFDTPVQVIVRVHESDKVTADESTIIFDPWRSYPKANNVIYYGYPAK